MSSQGPAIVHYEVYALDGQRWTLHARFRKDEKEDALAEAKAVEGGLGMCTKVVRETYYPGNNTSDETLVYSSDKNFKPRTHATAAPRRAYARGGAGFETTIATPDFRMAERARAASSISVLLKVLLVVAAALAIAFGVSAVVNNFVSKLNGDISANSASLLTFLAFVISFLVTGVPLALSVVDWRDNKSGKKRKSPDCQSAYARESKPADETATVEEKLEEAPLPPKESEPEPPEPPEKVEEKAGEPEEKIPEPEENPETGQTEDEAADAKEEDALSDPLETLRMIMIRFLSSLLQEIKKVRPTLDAYNIFGIDLMLAGAIEVLGTQKHLELEDKRSILRNAIEVMGTKKEVAKAFADRYEDYLVEPKYMSMVQAGRNNMEAMMAGAEIATGEIGQTIETWNKPQQAPGAGSRIVTVLFTDMVGSTDLTQARGDHAAQDVVRRHNSIVRTALAEYVGKEIKHTGDGIMASFASAANAIEAAIVIQRACASHNLARPDQSLHLRIGLNAGEPIEEEDDLFGTTVQLSARVCAKAETDQILCTNVVRELSAGKDLSFTSKGVHELKGFKDPVPLHEVIWQPAADIPSTMPPPPRKEGKSKAAAKQKESSAKQKVAADTATPSEDAPVSGH